MLYKRNFFQLSEFEAFSVFLLKIMSISCLDIFSLVNKDFVLSTSIANLALDSGSCSTFAMTSKTCDSTIAGTSSSIFDFCASVMVKNPSHFILNFQDFPCRDSI